MGEPVVHEYASGQRKDLRLVLQAAEGSRIDEPIAVAFELRSIVMAQGMSIFLPQTSVGYELFAVHHNAVCFVRKVTFYFLFSVFLIFKM